MSQLSEFLKQGLKGQELSAETLTAGTVTIAGEVCVCSKTGLVLGEALDEHGHPVPVFRMTVRVRREVLDDADLVASDYAVNKTVALGGRNMTIAELVDREELPHVVLRCVAPGAEG